MSYCCVKGYSLLPTNLLISSPGSFPLTFQAYYTSSQMSSPFCFAGELTTVTSIALLVMSGCTYMASSCVIIVVITA
jgi:hypothetical protein